MSHAGREQGFTLVEMMVVVALIGVLSAIAIPWLKETDDAEAAARELAGLLGSASQLAASHGPVAASIVEAEIGDASRVRIRISASVPHVASVDLRTEVDADSSRWDVVSTYTVGNAVEISGSEPFANLAGGGAPAAGDIVIGCDSAGQCTPTTLYLRQRNSDRNKVRVIVLPLSQSPTVRVGW